MEQFLILTENLHSGRDQNIKEKKLSPPTR